MNTLHFDCLFTYPSGFHLDLHFTTSQLLTGLVGPSGAGKTTTLRLIAGFLKPHSGTILFNSTPWVDSSSHVYLPPERRHIGFLFQDYQLFPHLSVFLNLRYGWARNGQRSANLDALIDIFQLRPLLYRLPKTLSGGEQQRVALARSILASPQLLLLDEPLSAVDNSLQQQLSDFLRSYVATHQTTTLIVSHSQSWLDSLQAQTFTLPSSPSQSDNNL